MQARKVRIEDENIKKTGRLGKYNKEKPNRLLLANLDNCDLRLELFRDIIASGTLRNILVLERTTI